MNSIQDILNKLHYENVNPTKKADVDLYPHILSDVPIVYFSIPQPDNILNNILLELWNENKARLYVTINTNKSLKNPDIQLYNPRIKPRLNNLPIDSFSYGLNADKYNKIFDNLERERIDTGIFWEFIKDKLQKRRESTVDKDLIKKLVTLRQRLLKNLDDKAVHILIDRCIFIKFMEDRKFIGKEFFEAFNCENFADLLSKNKFDLLIKAFEKANKLLNGDIFIEQISNNINKQVIIEIHKFFTTDYLTDQLKIFPYKFDIISLPLISNIYETFLKEVRREKGIYYTPESVVDLILDETVEKKINQNIEKGKKPDITVFDSTCGSGIFLVKALRKLLNGHKKYYNNKKLTFEQKSKILKDNVYGVDSDEKAIRIATFSLYLALLEGEKAGQGLRFPKIKESNLLVKNSLKEVFKGKKFDCIIGNPPWGYKFKENDRQLLTSLNNKFQCSDKQSSQFFLMKAKGWSKENSQFGFVVNNSIFYNLEADKFRTEFIRNYKLTKYIELSKIKDIIFKSSNHPGVILIFNNELEEDSKVDFYTPRHNKLSKYLGIILLGNKDSKVIKSKELLENDELWRILVNGDLKDWYICQKLFKMPQKLITLTGPKNVQQGLIAYDKHKGHTERMRKTKLFHDTKQINSLYKEVITSANVNQYKILTTRSNYIKYGEWLGRPRKIELFQGNRIFLKRTFNHSKLRVESCFLDYELLCENSVIILKLSREYDRKEIYLLLQAILNSSLAGYFFSLISPKTMKGVFPEITPKIIKKFPIPVINTKDVKTTKLIYLSNKIMQSAKDNNIEQLQGQIDELVFDIYNLSEIERQRIRDFYLVNIKRKEDKVNELDMENYLNHFKKIFKELLKEKMYLNVGYYISSLLGAAVCFKIEDREKAMAKSISDNKMILQLLTNVITNERIKEYDFTNILGQRKINIYDKNRFYIIKSNEVRDWTSIEAIEDAKEEIISFFNVR